MMMVAGLVWPGNVGNALRIDDGLVDNEGKNAKMKK